MLFTFTFAAAQTKPETLPPMGWTIPCATPCLSGSAGAEAKTKATADAVKNNGLLSHGWTQGGVDAGWATSRSGGNLVTDATAYPDGMAATVSYVKADGFTFSLYFNPGTLGCATQVPSGGHETADMALAASYLVDQIRADNCTNGLTATTAQAEYQAIANGMGASGRLMALSVSLANTDPLTNGLNSLTWCPTVGGGDVFTTKDLGTGTGGLDTWANVLTRVDKQIGLSTYPSTPTCWYNIWFLQGGMGVLTDTEGQSEFSLFAEFEAPLNFTYDPTVADSTTCVSAICTAFSNDEVIAVDQDADGFPGWQASSVACGDSSCQVYVKPGTGSTWTLALLNRASTSQTISATWSMFGGSGTYSGRDLWAHSNLGNITSYSTSVASHAVAMIKLTPTVPPTVGSGLGAGMTIGRGMQVQ